MSLPSGWHYVSENESVAKSDIPVNHREVYSNRWVEGRITGYKVMEQVERHVKYIHRHIPDVESVMDVGCGTGELVDKLNELGYEASGIDREDIAISYASLHRKGEFSLVEIKDLENVEFDLVTAHHVIEHQDNPVDFLLDCRDRIKEGGYIYLALPSMEKWNPKSKSWAALDPFVTDHIYAFTMEGIMECLKTTNFEVVHRERRFYITHVKAAVGSILTRIYRRWIYRGKKESTLVGEVYAVGTNRMAMNRLVRYVLGSIVWVFEKLGDGYEICILARKID